MSRIVPSCQSSVHIMILLILPARLFGAHDDTVERYDYYFFSTSPSSLTLQRISVCPCEGTVVIFNDDHQKLTNRAQLRAAVTNEYYFFFFFYLPKRETIFYYLRETSTTYMYVDVRMFAVCVHRHDATALYAPYIGLKYKHDSNNVFGNRIYI